MSDRRTRRCRSASASRPGSPRTRSPRRWRRSRPARSRRSRPSACSRARDRGALPRRRGGRPTRRPSSSARLRRARGCPTRSPSAPLPEGRPDDPPARRCSSTHLGRRVDAPRRAGCIAGGAAARSRASSVRELDVAGDRARRRRLPGRGPSSLRRRLEPPRGGTGCLAGIASECGASRGTAAQRAGPAGRFEFDGSRSCARMPFAGMLGAHRTETLRSFEVPTRWPALSGTVSGASGGAEEPF